MSAASNISDLQRKPEAAGHIACALNMTERCWLW